ncbi:MAG: hypothetical protein M1837_000390 [Sclerophora amabilis]|nr:MAG: hypothetical protein M1837_000390 [Sclerophora amabilis]
MAAPVPQIRIAKPVKGGTANGILPNPALATKNDTPKADAQKAVSNKTVGPRLKIVIRRLPPGLTRSELESALGKEWKLGAGRVDWMVYKAGKVSQDPAKPSRPSRIYLHLTDQEHLTSLSDKVHQTTIQDAQGTWNSPALLGPPSVEFAPYGRIPATKRRNDARQGTIDQDPEFISFLENLTNPIAKPGSGDAGNEEGGKKDENPTITPLIKFLKEKKASKGKDAASPLKGSKHGRPEAKGSRSDKTVDKKSAGKAPKILSSQGRQGGKDSKGDEAAQNAVKVLNREASTLIRKGKPIASAPVAPAGESKENSAPSNINSTPEKRRERGNASAAARMLQRDLGLGPGAAGRRGSRKEALEASKSGSEATKSSPSRTGTGTGTGTTSGAVAAQGKPVVLSRSDTATSANDRRSKKTVNGENAARGRPKDAAPSNAPTGPADATSIMKKAKATAQPSSEPTVEAAPSSTKAASAATATPAAKRAQKATKTVMGTQAFLKHANPSQGITEPLLQVSMETFGPVTKVEIDKKKGFAYVDFGSVEGLQKAIEASPVKIAEGQVTVLERKDKGSSGPGAKGGRFEKGRGGASSGARGGRGRGKGAVGRGGSPQVAPAASQADGGKAPVVDTSGPAS